ncbi:hypothetical protein [Streptomyces sp. NPDC026673]|uniref:hypothetical protein n=1 Tax=Streptomyces sp. NPDC026673 TaxID=3155724 RepID=UPI0033EDE0C7
MPDAWDGASTQRRTVASRFGHDHYGERHHEIVFTGIALDTQHIDAAPKAALFT